MSLGTSASSPSLLNQGGALSPPTSSSTPPASSHSISKQADPKREILRVRAESLIPRVSVTKTTELNIVSIVLYVHFPSAKQLRQARKERKERQLVTGATDMSDVGDDEEEEQGHSVQESPQPQDVTDKSATSTSSSSGTSTPPQRTAGVVKDVTDIYSEQVAASSASTLSTTNASLTTSPLTTAQTASQVPTGSPPLSLLSSPVSSAELTPIHIASYDFSRDNYLAVATEITHHYPTFSQLEMDGVEELVAFRIEEATRERYNKCKYISPHTTHANSPEAAASHIPPLTHRSTCSCDICIRASQSAHHPQQRDHDAADLTRHFAQLCTQLHRAGGESRGSAVPVGGGPWPTSYPSWDRADDCSSTSQR